MAAVTNLFGRSILVVEDEYFIAADIAEFLISLGAEVIGPCRTIVAAQSALQHSEFDFAVLDINVGGHHSFEIADWLELRGVPFLFISGYDDVETPSKFAHVVRLAKPLPLTRLASAIDGRVKGGAEQKAIPSV